MLSPGGSFLQYTGQDDADERDDDEVLLLQFEEDCDDALENQALNGSGHFDVRAHHYTAAATTTTMPSPLDSFEEYPPAYRHPPSNLRWPRSDGYAADLKNFEVSDESDSEKGSDEDETLYFADTMVDQKFLSVGDECLCLDSRDGLQWVATIKKKTGRHALVHYKGWSKSCDDWVSLSSISPKPTQAVLDRLKIYNSCTKKFNSNSRSVAPAVYVPTCSIGDDERECEARNDCRGVEPVTVKNRKNGNVTGWNAICWKGNTKQFIAGSPFHSVDEAAKAWDASAAFGSNGFASLGSWVNIPPQQSFKTPKFPLGSRALLARKGKARQAGGVVSGFLGRGKYLVKPDDGECTVVSLPNPMVTIVSRPPYRVSDKAEDLEDVGLQIALRKLHSVCEQYPSTHVLGALGLAIGSVRTLWRQCHRSGILLHQSCAYSTSSFDVLKPLAQALLVSSLACVATEGEPITSQTPADEISEKSLCPDTISPNNSIRYSVTIKDRKNSVRAVVNGEERASKVLKSSAEDLEAHMGFDGDFDSAMNSMQASEAGKARRNSIVDTGLMVDLLRDKTVKLFVGEVSGLNCEKDSRREIDDDCFRSAASDVDSPLLPPVDVGSAKVERQKDSPVPDACEEKVHFGSISVDAKVLDDSAPSLIFSSEVHTHDLNRTSLDPEIQPRNLDCVGRKNDSTATDKGPQELPEHPTAPIDQGVDGCHQMSDANQQHQIPASGESQVCDDQSVSRMSKVNEPSSIQHPPTLLLISGGTNDSDRVSKMSCHIHAESDLKRTRDLVPEKPKRSPPDPPSPRRRALRPAKVIAIDGAHHPTDQANVEDASLRQKLKRSSARNVLSDEADTLNSGQRVEVRCKGEWWVAHLERRAAGQAQVRYLGADGGYGPFEWVNEDRIRPVQTQPESECNLDPRKLIGVCAIEGEQGLTLWSASIKIRNKEVRVGTFTTMQEAAEAYDMAALQQGSARFVRLNRPQMRDQYMVIIQGRKPQSVPFEAACTAAKQKRNCSTTRSEVGLGPRMPNVTTRPSGRRAKRNADDSLGDGRSLGDCRVANTNRPANDSRSDSFSRSRSAKSGVSHAGKSAAMLKRGRAPKQKDVSTPSSGFSKQQRTEKSELRERKEVVDEVLETQASGCSNDGLERKGCVTPNISPSDTPETVSRHGHEGMTPLRCMEQTKPSLRARSLIASTSGVDLSNVMSSDGNLFESSSEGAVRIQRSDSDQLRADSKHSNDKGHEDIPGSLRSGVSECRPIHCIDTAPQLMTDTFPSMAAHENGAHHQVLTECIPADFFLQQQQHSPLEGTDIVQAHGVNCCLSSDAQHSESSKLQDALPCPPPSKHDTVSPLCQPQEMIGLVPEMCEYGRIHQSSGMLETPFPASSAADTDQKKYYSSLNCSEASNTAKSDSGSFESCRTVSGITPNIGFEALAVGAPQSHIASNDEKCEPTAIADGLLSGTALGRVEELDLLQQQLVQEPPSTFHAGAVSSHTSPQIPYNIQGAQEELQRLGDAADGCCGSSLHAVNDVASDAFGIPAVWDGAAQEHLPQQQIASDYEMGLNSKFDQPPKTAANDCGLLSQDDLLFGNLGQLQDNFESCGAVESAGSDLLFGDPADNGHAPEDPQSCTQAACGDTMGAKRRRLMADKAPFVGS